MAKKNYEIFKCQIQKLGKEIKKNWSQMIQKCQIQREKAKQSLAADGGFRQ